MQRRLEHMEERLAAADTCSGRVGAAADFLRGALKHADPATAKAITDEVVPLLRDAGTRAFGHRKETTR